MEKVKSFEFQKSSVVYIYSIMIVVYLVCFMEGKRLDKNDSEIVDLYQLPSEFSKNGELEVIKVGSEGDEVDVDVK